MERQTLEPMMTAKEVALIIRADVSTVYREARRGRLPFARMGNLMRFRRVDVEAYATPKK